MSAPIRIATRGSPLALAQANLILKQCQAVAPAEKFAIKIIKTTGDKLQAASLAGSGLPKGLFTKEIEEALLANEADLAVHSLKDLPTELPAQLCLGAVTRRADVRDVLLYRDLEYAIRHVDPLKPVQQKQHGFRPALSVQSLPYRAVVATSSARRAAQLLEQRADLKIVNIRGNVGTRLNKLADQIELDALILASAGLERLGLGISPAGILAGESVPPGIGATCLSVDQMLPCVGQAAIGLEIRQNDPRLGALCDRVNDPPTNLCVTAERAFLKGMGGGCQVAVAAYAELKQDQLHLRGVSFLEGPRRGEVRGEPARAAELGHELATLLKTPAA